MAGVYSVAHTMYHRLLSPQLPTFAASTQAWGQKDIVLIPDTTTDPRGCFRLDGLRYKVNDLLGCILLQGADTGVALIYDL
jgi:hypothetical protein